MKSVLKDFYFKVVENDFELENCYRLRYNVYCEEKAWLSKADFPNGMETDKYDDRAMHIIALDHDFNAVGTMRILRDKDYDYLPYEKHPSLKGKKLDLPNLVELSRFVIRSQSNTLQITRGILRAVYQSSLNIGVDNWVNVCEPSLIRLLSMFKYYFEPAANPAMYYGGFTQPVVLNVAETQKRWQKEDEDAWNYYHTTEDNKRFEPLRKQRKLIS